MFLFKVIGWIIVAAFAVTFAITILSLIGKVQIEDAYKKKLFNALILEIVSAGFFLFYEGLKAPHHIFTRPEKVYAFAENGSPVELTLFSDDSAKPIKRFPKISQNAFKNILRGAVVNQNKLYLTTGTEPIYLGYVADAREKLGPQLLPPKAALYLGQHLSEMVSGKRRAPFQAVRYLLMVLRDSTGGAEEKAIASQKLVFLVKYIKSAQDFDLLIQRIQTYRAEDYNRYFELAETYLEYAKLSGLSREMRDEKHKLALENYLLLLSTPESATRELSARRETAKRRAKELIDMLSLRDAEVRQVKDDLKKAVDRHDRSRLLSYLQRLFTRDLSER